MDLKSKGITKKDKQKFLLLLIILVVLVVATVLLVPFFAKFADETQRQELIGYIRGKGFWGIAILLGLQILQVVVAVIPGEVVQVVSGILYGTFGGFVLCIVGALLSSILIFYLVRKLGTGFVEKMVPKGQMERFHFLHDSRKLETITFILFLIPGTPKDLLTYLVPLTEIRPMRFFLISTFARMPALIASTFAGSTIDKGNWEITILLFVGACIIGVAGIFLNDRIMKKMGRKDSPKE